LIEEEKKNHVLVPEEIDAEIEDSDEVRMLAADFEIGHMLRDSIVPKAVLYYTGEVGDEDDGEVRKTRKMYSMIYFFYDFSLMKMKMMKMMVNIFKQSKRRKKKIFF
jgi:hypothetical protein